MKIIIPFTDKINTLKVDTLKDLIKNNMIYHAG